MKKVLGIALVLELLCSCAEIAGLDRLSPLRSTDADASAASGSAAAADGGQPVSVALEPGTTPRPGTGERPPSCAGDGPGIDDCGLNEQDDCCVSVSVAGGSVVIGVGPDEPVARVDGFRLDKYEVTLGRFRVFLSAVVDGGWSPPIGSGKHTHLANGALSGEQGWREEWSLDRLQRQWEDQDHLGCEGGNWTSEPSAEDNHPATCLRWVDAYAFCIWDGGFLPTRAEWNYVAAGGSEQWRFPWGNQPVPDAQHAVYNLTDGSEVPHVGSRSPQGDGLWQHADLPGSVWEWILDGTLEFPSPCDNCLTPGDPGRKAIGGGFRSDESFMTSFVTFTFAEGQNVADTGARCARLPRGAL